MQGASEVQISTVLSTTVRASGLHNGRAGGRHFAAGSPGAPTAAARFLAASNRLHLGGLRVPALVPPRTSLVISLHDESGIAFRAQFFHNAQGVHSRGKEAKASPQAVSGSFLRGRVAAGLAVGGVEPDGVLGL